MTDLTATRVTSSFAAPACKLTDAQADANFDYFLTNKASRIDVLADLLTGFDIDVHAGMNATSLDPLVAQLYQWSGEHWPMYFDKAIHNERHWIASNKQEGNRIYSVIMDTAIVMGELIIKHRPTYCWNLDRDPDNKIMASYNRCVLTARWLPETDGLIAVDIEADVAQRFLHADYSGQRSVIVLKSDPFGKYCLTRPLPFSFAPLSHEL